MNEEMEHECLRIEEDSTFSSKGHFESARFWGATNLILGTISAIVAAIAGLSAFNEHPVTAGFLAVFSATLTAILTYINPSKRSNSHLNAGNLYKGLQNDTRVFRKVEILEMDSQKDQVEVVKELSQRRNELNQNSPQVPRFAFLAARKGIESGEASYKTDEGKD
jgi:hypothetical protein